jgi:hypothetical protein
VTANQVLIGAGLILVLGAAFRKLRGHTRRVVNRLIVLGVPVTFAFGAVFAGLLEVLMWAGFDEQRERIKEAGLELAPGELLEGITAVLLLTAEDDFNALGSTVLAGGVDGPVYRLAARLPGHGVVAPYTGGEVLFDPRLTRYEVGRRYAAGTRIRTRPANGSAPADDSLLFLVRADGRLAPVTASGPPRSEPGDTMVLFCPAADGP